MLAATKHEWSFPGREANSGGRVFVDAIGSTAVGDSGRPGLLLPLQKDELNFPQQARFFFRVGLGQRCPIQLAEIVILCHSLASQIPPSGIAGTVFTIAQPGVHFTIKIIYQPNKRPKVELMRCLR